MIDYYCKERTRNEDGSKGLTQVVHQLENIFNPDLYLKQQQDGQSGNEKDLEANGEAAFIRMSPPRSDGGVCTVQYNVLVMATRC